jgi:hypothetical protein
VQPGSLLRFDDCRAELCVADPGAHSQQGWFQFEREGCVCSQLRSGTAAPLCSYAVQLRCPPAHRRGAAG